MSKWLKVGEAERLEDEEWSATVEDLCDLMNNYKTAISIGNQQEFAARAIDFVLANLERRKIIQDRFKL